MTASVLYQKAKDFFHWLTDHKVLVVIALVVLAGLLVRSACVEHTKTVDETVEQQRKTTTDEHQRTDAQVQQTEHKQTDGTHDVDVKKHVTRTKTTVKKPDGTEVTRERETTDYEKTEQTEQHETETAQRTETTTQETTTHVEEQEQTKTTTHIVETESTGFGTGLAKRLSLGFYLSQDLRSAFRGKLDISPGVTAGVRLLGPARLDVGIDLNANAWVVGSVGIFGISVGQNLKDLGSGFHPVPGIGVNFPVLSHLSVGAGIDLHASSNVSLTVRL